MHRSVCYGRDAFLCYSFCLSRSVQGFRLNYFILMMMVMQMIYCGSTGVFPKWVPKDSLSIATGSGSKIGKKFEKSYRYINRGFSPGTGS